MEGTVHKQKQGTGLATILNTDRLFEIKSQRAKQKQEAESKLADFDPEAWYIYDKQIKDMVDNVITQGALLMNEGIKDPFSSTDERSIEWRKQMKKVERYANATVEMKGNFSALQQIYLDPEKQRKIANWDEISDYYLNNENIGDLIDSGQAPPSLKYKKPVVDTLATVVNLSETWKKQNPNSSMKEGDSYEYANDITSNEAYSDFVLQERQVYDNLPQEEKNRFDNIAKKNGYQDGFVGYLGTKVRNYTTPDRINVYDEIVSSVGKIFPALAQEYKATKSIKGKKEKAKGIADSLLALYPYIIDESDENLSPEERYDEAYNKLYKQAYDLLDFTQTKFIQGYNDYDTILKMQGGGAAAAGGGGGGGGGTIKKEPIDYTRWLQDLYQNEDEVLIKQASDFLTGIKIYGGVVTDTNYNPQTKSIDLVIKGDVETIKKESGYDQIREINQNTIVFSMSRTEADKQQLVKFYEMAWQNNNVNYRNVRDPNAVEPETQTQSDTIPTITIPESGFLNQQANPVATDPLNLRQ